MENKKEELTPALRAQIYSYFETYEILNTVGLLSKAEREVVRNSLILQTRFATIILSPSANGDHSSDDALYPSKHAQISSQADCDDRSIESDDEG